VAPILEELGKWMKAQYIQTLPKSPIGKALAYSIERRDKLCLYTTNGMLNIDNNPVEGLLHSVFSTFLLLPVVWVFLPLAQGRVHSCLPIAAVVAPPSSFRYARSSPVCIRLPQQLPCCILPEKKLHYYRCITKRIAVVPLPERRFKIYTPLASELV
jgi:Transposase IS66 family